MPKTHTSDVFDRLAERQDGVDPDEAGDAADDAVAESAGADSGDDSTDDGAGDPGDRGSWRYRAKAMLIGAVLLAALGLSGFLGWRLYQVDATAAAGRAALEAAKNYAITLTTLDAANIDGNYTQALDGATGEFKDAYSLGSAQLRQILIDNNATGKGVVVDAAVKSATKTKVEVLLFVDQSITNAVRSDPRIDRNRIQMTMELVDNRWLASQVELA